MFACKCATTCTCVVGLCDVGLTVRLNEQTQEKILRLLFHCVNIDFHNLGFLSRQSGHGILPFHRKAALGLMVIVTVFLKSSAKVVYFCELCKKNFSFASTISVNII